MDGIFRPLYDIEEYIQTLRTLRESNSPIMITGLFESQKAHLSSALVRELNRPSVFITYNEVSAKKVYDDLKFFLGERILFYPSKEILLFNVEAEGLPLTIKRLQVIEKILTSNNYVVVLSIEALQNKIMPLDVYKKYSKKLKVGERYSIAELVKLLTYVGYQHSEIIEGKGQFSVRGGILDFFPINSDYPYRIDFFDDEIDCIKIFDIASQRSISNQNEAKIFPVKEIVFDNEITKHVIDKINKDLNIVRENTKVGHEYYLKLEKRVLQDIEKLNNGIHFAGIEKYINYFYEDATNLLEYLPKDSLVFIDEHNKIEQSAQNHFMQFSELMKDSIEKGNILPRCIDCVYQFNSIMKYAESKKAIYINTFLQTASHLKPSKTVNIASRPIPAFNGRLELLLEDIKKWKSTNNKILILAGSSSKAQKLGEFFAENNISYSTASELSRPPKSGEVIIARGSIGKGFEYSLIKFIVISDREILGEEKKKSKKKKIAGQKIKAFSELKSGDYVVHQVHGIGQYIGIEKLKVEGITKDYFKIKYMQGDLFVPVSQLDLIQKYIGSEGRAPKVNKLGGADWSKTKSKVKESVQDLAKELIKLYAQRQTLTGFTFSKDNIWQRQFEETFPYDETDDQLQSIEEVKKDMEASKPMDRLLCGDVGYGKTEVAIRAAFKAVMDGKQVAYLVPTTILAQQHYNNFVQRMKDFPVKVDMLSRFRSPKEQKETIKNLKSGLVDIIIGTHRILQKDLVFKDLGLVIVDEEQRFGVMHKEQLKNLKKNVDVLTLTATPIPRTLHMALVGVRDMSVIEEPPEERQPVQTYVLEHDNEMIREAILREKNRGGQVFYLYNRVASIHKVSSALQNLIPEVKVGYAHGQMSENELEDIIMDFLNGEFDVMVCTTIIETGLDMPNVNTIIIEDADKMGLAQLYQLRGRVGRSNRQAYAYLTFRKDKVLSEDADKRLKAIKEFTEFGSGYKIAMRDLEIRGAGNLIGPEQHGHMNAVGYDMYCKILEDSIRELKGEKVKDVVETLIDINISAYIDDKYISNSIQKITMYKKIASIENYDDVMDIKSELLDRYGDLPKEVDNLVEVAYIKSLCVELNILSVVQKGANVIFTFKDVSDVDIMAIGEISNKFKRRILFTASNSPYITFKVDGILDKLLDNIKFLLQSLKNSMNTKK